MDDHWHLADDSNILLVLTLDALRHCPRVGTSLRHNAGHDFATSNLLAVAHRECRDTCWSIASLAEAHAYSLGTQG